MWSGVKAWVSGSVPPAGKNPKFYALRQRAAFFGYNAVNPLMLTPKIRMQLGALLNVAKTEWKFGESSDGSNLVTENLVDLDATYSKLAAGGWLALIVPDSNVSRSPAGVVGLAVINSVTTISRADYAMSAKITRLAVDSQPNLATYYNSTRHTSVLAQSEEFAAAEQPLTYPLYGSLLDLQGVRVDLAGVQAVAVYGKSQKLQVNPGINTLVFTPDDDSGDLTLKPRDIITLLGPRNLPLGSDGTIPDWTNRRGVLPLSVLDPSGRAGTLAPRRSEDFTLVPASSKDPGIQELALVSVGLGADLPVSSHTNPSRLGATELL